MAWAFLSSEKTFGSNSEVPLNVVALGRSVEVRDGQRPCPVSMLTRASCPVSEMVYSV